MISCLGQGESVAQITSACPLTDPVCTGTPTCSAARVLPVLLPLFIALSVALKSLPVIAVNLLNASQVAMAAVAGILLFSEPVTNSLVIGVALTLIGLVAMVQRRSRESTELTQ